MQCSQLETSSEWLAADTTESPKCRPVGDEKRTIAGNGTLITILLCLILPLLRCLPLSGKDQHVASSGLARFGPVAPSRDAKNSLALTKVILTPKIPVTSSLSSQVEFKTAIITSMTGLSWVSKTPAGASLKNHYAAISLRP